MKYRVIKQYDEAPAEPIRLVVGERVSAVKESDPKGDWPDWIYCRGLEKEGWVPAQYLDVSEGEAVLREEYYAREFNLVPGELIIGEKELNGWVWGWKAQFPGQYGWAPLNHLEKIGYL